MSAIASAADAAKPSHIKPSGNLQPTLRQRTRKPIAANPHATFTTVGTQSIQ